MVYITLFDVVP